jgi:hypothetical protein
MANSRNLTVTIVVMLGLCGLDFAVPAAVAAEERPNLAFCTNNWSYDRDGRFYTLSNCEFAVEIQFMSEADPHPVARTLDESDGMFTTGLTKSQVESGWWMSTTCEISIVTGRPLKPDVSFIPANRDRIKSGNYKCVGD